MANHKKQVVTAIIYDRKGRILSIGNNSYIKTHPYQKKLAVRMGFSEKIYIHAEIHSIIKCKDLKKAHSIFISRYDKNGNPMCAKPCEICTEALKIAGIKNITYTI